MGTELPTAAQAKARVQGHAKPWKHRGHLPASPPQPPLRVQSETWGGLWALPGWEVPPTSVLSAGLVTPHPGLVTPHTGLPSSVYSVGYQLQLSLGAQAEWAAQVKEPAFLEPCGQLSPCGPLA